MSGPAPAARCQGGYHSRLGRDRCKPAPAPARAIGGYARGCLGGAVALPTDGTGYQVMRPSRNRYYGHPRLVAFVQDFAKRHEPMAGRGC